MVRGVAWEWVSLDVTGGGRLIGGGGEKAPALICRIGSISMDPGMLRVSLCVLSIFSVPTFYTVTRWLTGGPSWAFCSSGSGFIVRQKLAVSFFVLLLSS